MLSLFFFVAAGFFFLLQEDSLTTGRMLAGERERKWGMMEEEMKVCRDDPALRFMFTGLPLP